LVVQKNVKIKYIEHNSTVKGKKQDLSVKTKGRPPYEDLGSKTLMKASFQRFFTA
jgi:hypothetical protein